jgi:ferredoxin
MSRINFCLLVMLVFRKEMGTEMSKEQATDGRNYSGANWPVPQINLTLCDGCVLCIKVCPNHVLDLNKGIAVVAFPEHCNYSGLCEQACPTTAITRVFVIIWPDEVNNE